MITGWQCEECKTVYDEPKPAVDCVHEHSDRNHKPKLIVQTTWSEVTNPGGGRTGRK